MSSVCCPLSSRLATLVPCLLLACSAAAMTNNLTYAAAIGKFDSSGKVSVWEDLSTNVTMTVAIFPNETATTPYWCRRINTDVVAGDFAVVLSDDAGVDPSATEFGALSKYGQLEKLFSAVDLDMAYWIGVSHVTLGADANDGQSGEPLPGATVSPVRGRIAGAPFVLIAERAVEARNTFCIRGAATVATLKTTGTVTVEGEATFADTVTFNRLAKFGSEGLVVTGLVSKTTMDEIGTFEADALHASKSASVGDFVVTGGSATILMPASIGFTPPSSMSVSGTLDITGTMNVKNRLSADGVESVGTFELTNNGILEWDSDGGSLSVPDGVYEADSENKNLKSVSAVDSWIEYRNETGTDALVTQIAGAHGNAAASSYINNSTTYWATYGLTGGSSGFFITVLYPLANGDKLGAYNVRTRYTKELSK